MHSIAVAGRTDAADHISALQAAPRGLLLASLLLGHFRSGQPRQTCAACHGIRSRDSDARSDKQEAAVSARQIAAPDVVAGRTEKAGQQKRGGSHPPRCRAAGKLRRQRTGREGLAGAG